MHYVKSTPLQEVEGGGGASASAALRYAGLRSAAAAHAILHDAQHLSALVLRSHAVKIVEKHLVRSSADHAASETRPKERAQGGWPDFHVVDVAVQGLVQSIHELCHATKPRTQGLFARLYAHPT